MHRRLLLALAAASTLMLPGPLAARPSISAQAAPDANFGAYKIFTWGNNLPPQGVNPVAFQRIQSDVELGLASKGYQKGPPPADITLILSVGAQQKTDFESWGRFGLQTDAYSYTQGSLSVDMFDTKTKRALWHGQATETINPEKPNASEVDVAVAKLMARFPGAAAP